MEVVNSIVKFKPYREELENLKQENAKIVFDYEDKKGNKEARSYVRKLRSSKSAVESLRKEEKQASLEYGRKVDAEAKEIISEIEKMISVHQERIDAIEKREAERVQSHQKAIYEISKYLELTSDYNSKSLKDDREEFKNICAENRNWEEFEGQYLTTKEAVENHFNQIIPRAEKREADEAELEQLRIKDQQRQKEEYERRLKEEAAEKARIEAEQKAAREKAEAERQKVLAEERERQAKAAQEAAEKRAAEAERVAKENAERAQREKEEREAAEKAKLEADENRRALIMQQAYDSLMNLGFLSQERAMLITRSIRDGAIKHVSIDFTAEIEHEHDF